jgi:glycine dehydrogenase
MPTMSESAVLEAPSTSSETQSAKTSPFLRRHLGPSGEETRAMLDAVGAESVDALTRETVPEGIRTDRPLDLPAPLSEEEALAEARRVADKNEVWRSFIGMGYHGCTTPPVIRRNILENPAWYTHYTPYQAEIAQGRLEALLNFQTLTIDLTGLPLANASLLDEASAAAEAVLMLHRADRQLDGGVFLVSEECHPQTINVVRTRAEPVGIEVRTGDHRAFDFEGDGEETVFGALVQYPATGGAVYDYQALADKAHRAEAHVVCAADPLALTLLEAPGRWGADVCVGSMQRFGVPMGYGGPHAAFFSCCEDFKRQIPGRMIGVSKDASGERALRMALQTREQHIRRGKATSNICTAQVLLAVMAQAYAVYHGPEGLREIAGRVHQQAKALSDGLQKQGHRVRHRHVFDTLRVDPVETDTDAIRASAEAEHVNLRYFSDGSVGVALDETTTPENVQDLLHVFGSADAPPSSNGTANGAAPPDAQALIEDAPPAYEGPHERETPFLEHETFHRHQSETALVRYLRRLERRDFSLADGMIPLGSCTMKLNPTAALEPISWPAFGELHPYAPSGQAEGYDEALGQLKAMLEEITGFDAASLQPNSGATGEYAGMLAIRAYHRSRGEGHRDVCLIPDSAHGTNPASANMAGMNVVVVDSDDDGSIDLKDLRAKAEKHASELAALMLTYPSTHGVFEEHVREVTAAIHEHGGQVYLDGANMSAMAGLARPAELGADCCHLNLHKTFAIPHGGGGPGVGPILAKEHLAPFLPGHPLGAGDGEDQPVGPVSAAPHGSALVTLVSWAYLRMLGGEGLRRTSEIAILSANYLAARLEEGYGAPVFTGAAGRVAHELILDLRPFRSEYGVTEQDVAKRLMDYGFHAPTVSWPVVGGMMIEPTESESKREIDRFAEAMLGVREEIRAVESGEVALGESPLRQAPHPAEMMVEAEWDRAYSRADGVFPAPWSREDKYWPTVRRVDEAYGDRNLVCSCPPVEAYE